MLRTTESRPQLHGAGLPWRLAALLLAALLATPLLPARPAYAATLTVNSTGDGADATSADGICETATAGECTLRAAIEQANALAGLDTIAFSIPGPGPHTIARAAALPPIAGPLVIDGLTEPGASCAAWPPTLQIELDATGSTDGLFVNTGGLTARGLVINRYSFSAVNLFSTSSGSALECNFLGTNIAGDAAVGSAQTAIFANGSGANTIGGAALGQRNLISGVHALEQIRLAGANGNVVQGNYIGTNAAGTASLAGSNGTGILITGSNNAIGGTSGTTPGGPCTGACNLIAGAVNQQVWLSNPGITGNSVAGNHIGVNAAGTARIDNPSALAPTGVRVTFSSGVTIGSASPAGRNVIGGQTTGVRIDSAQAIGTIVRGNYIGTNAAGTARIANSYGVSIINGTGTAIGGAELGEGNLISGNFIYGVEIQSSAAPVSLQGNLIGLNAAGTAALGNDLDGVYLHSGATGHTIGSTGEGIGGNVIAGNGNANVHLAGASGNTVRGNRIGLNAAGTAAVANNFGVLLDSGASNNTIGGTGTGAANVISGSTGSFDNGVGVFLIGATTANNTIRGNIIGLSADGSAPVPNSIGIGISDATGTIIGGAAGEGNTIAGNNGAAVSVFSGSGNSIRGNAIYGNGDAIALAGGANSGQAPPTITSAVPDAGDPLSTADDTIRIQGWMIGTPATPYLIDLYATPACLSSGFGPGQTPLASFGIETGLDGVALLDVTVPAEVPFNHAVTATATQGLTGNTSTFSSCAPAGPDNDAWFTPIDLDAAPSQSINQFLALPGQTRWYRFSAQPRSRVLVDLTNLPGEYNVALFGDIAGSASALTDPPPGLQVLATENAELDYDAIEASNFVTNTLDPQLISPEAYTAEALSPASFRPNVLAPYAVSPFKTSTIPSIDTPAEEQAGIALDNALLSATGLDGTAPRSLVLNTWDTGGDYFVAVYGQNGSYSAARPFTLEVTAANSACSAIGTPAPDGALVTADGDFKTIVLTDYTRLPGTPGERAALDARLAAFLGRAEVQGIVVDVSEDGLVRAANDQADQYPDCPNAKNVVAEAIKGIVDRSRAANPQLAYVVLMGGDAVIPFFRTPDQAMLGNESTFSPPVQNGSASQASLRLGYTLGQDAYGSSLTVPFKSTSLVVPQLPVGRLVETAADATAMIDAYLAADGVLTPRSSLVSGYDFHYDSSLLIKDELDRGTARAGDALLSESTQSSQLPGTWTADELRDRLFGTRHDLLYLAGHFSDGGLLAADYRTSMTAAELRDAAVSLAGSLVISPGCHSGYNTVDPDSIDGVTAPVDWAQAFNGKGATLVAGTGYQYGDTVFVQFAEELYVYLAQQLRVGSGPVPVGQALAAAKQRYLAESVQLRGVDQKTLAVATLYGLPMMQVDMPGERLTLPAPASIVGPADLAPVEGNPYDLRSAVVTIAPTLAQESVPLIQTTNGASRTATYFRGAQGVVSNPAEPVLPLEQRDVTVPGQLLRGVVFLGGSYGDLLNRLPLTGAPATELRGVVMTFPTESLYPHKIWSANYFDAIRDPLDGRTRLSVTPAQYIANSPTSDIGTIRTFGDTSYRLFYNNTTAPTAAGVYPALAGPPSIVRVTSSASGSNVTFSVGAFGEETVGVQQVWVTYTGASGPLQGAWQSIELTRSGSDDLLWERTIALPSGASSGQLRFFVQAVNQVGLAALDTNQGAYYSVGVDPAAVTVAPVATQLSISAPASAPYGSDLSVTAELRSAGGDPLPFQPVSFSLDTLVREATTGPDGVATVSLPLGIDPAGYTLAANYRGDQLYRGAAAAAPLVVAKVASELAFESPPASVGTGALDSVSVTLADAAGRPIVGETVALVVSGAGGSYAAVLKTDAAGRAPLGLIPLPAGSYTVGAYFGGTIPDPISASYASPRYDAAPALTGSLTIVPAADVSAPITILGGAPPDPSGPDVTFALSGRDNLTDAAELQFECSLNGSAFLPCAAAQSYTGLAGGSYRFEARALDAAGNADETPAYYIWTVDGPPPPADTTAPAVTCAAAPAGWSATNVTISCTATDAGSGPATQSVALSTSVPAGTETASASTGSQLVCDLAGNCATAGPVTGIRVDRRAPSISVSGVVSGGSYPLASPPTISCSATDGGAGLDGPCAVTVTPPAGGGAGTYSYTATARDTVGNAGSVAGTYQLTGPTYAWSGFLLPVANPPTFNRVRAGLAVPVRFRLGGYQGMDIFVAGYPASQPIACTAGVPESEVDETSTAGNSGLIYNPLTRTYIYIWKTNSAWKGTCRQLVLKLADGSTRYANFRFR